MPDTVTVELDAAAAALVLALVREVGEQWQAADPADRRLSPLSRAYNALLASVHPSGGLIEAADAMATAAGNLFEVSLLGGANEAWHDLQRCAGEYRRLRSQQGKGVTDAE